jgi:hypothetical protein
LKFRKIISKPFRHEGKDASVAGGLNAVVSANVNEPGRSHTRVSSRQRIVQRNGRTEVFEEHHSSSSETDDPQTKEKSGD